MCHAVNSEGRHMLDAWPGKCHAENMWGEAHNDDNNGWRKKVDLTSQGADFLLPSVDFLSASGSF